MIIDVVMQATRNAGSEVPTYPPHRLETTVTIRVVRVLEEASGHARTFARKFCASIRFLDLSWRSGRTFPLSGWPKFRLSQTEGNRTV
jgi:hypothetical protein